MEERDERILAIVDTAVAVSECFGGAAVDATNPYYYYACSPQSSTSFAKISRQKQGQKGIGPALTSCARKYTQAAAAKTTATKSSSFLKAKYLFPLFLREPQNFISPTETTEQREKEKIILTKLDQCNNS